MRKNETYRGARRNQAKRDKIKFPWPGVDATAIEAAPVRANKRDRSEEAEAQRNKHVTMDFTDGVAGLSRSLINHEPPVQHQGKPKRGWAAKHRRKPFADCLPPQKMAEARDRHVHPRRKRGMRFDLPLAAE